MALKAKAYGKLAPPPPPSSIEELLSSLNDLIKREDFKRIVKVVDEVLAIAPRDEDAIRCKIVALTQGSKIKDAMRSIEVGQKLGMDLDFVKAYCLPRENKPDDALLLLKSAERNTMTLLLEAQILYRLGRIDDSLKIYQSLQKSKVDFPERTMLLVWCHPGGLMRSNTCLAQLPPMWLSESKLKTSKEQMLSLALLSNGGQMP